ncbi:MAG: toxin-antitoxin system YwqK family antitoxin [Bacteroidales bacterium]|nr:toxin-antitoxin system YwqK family antitoxin [Bacteroidales bacterium]
MKFPSLLITFIFILTIASCTRVETEYYPNGAIKSEITFKGKKENGPTIYYRQDGGKALEINMKNGKREGKLTRWFTNGMVEDISYYQNDSLDGIQTIYNMQGETVTRIEYKNGKKNGEYTSWHSRDLIKESGHFKNDFFDGKWEYFDKRGILVGEAEFKEGSGIQTAYDANGNIMRTTTYAHNLKNGPEKHFDKSGNIIETIHFQEDRIVSIDSCLNK